MDEYRQNIDVLEALLWQNYYGWQHEDYTCNKSFPATSQVVLDRKSSQLTQS